MIQDTYDYVRTGSVQDQIISKLEPDPGTITLILDGDVPADISSGSRPEGHTIVIDRAQMETEANFHIKGIGFKDGEYMTALLQCQEVQIPFQTSQGVQYVSFPVASRTVFSSWTYLWTNDTVLLPGHGKNVENVWSGSADPFFSSDFGDAEESFDYSCSVVGANAPILFVPYKHPTYSTTDRYNPTLGDAMVNTKYAEGLIVKTISGSFKKFVQDDHKSFGIGAFYPGQIKVNNSAESPAVRLESYVSGFIEQSQAGTGVGTGLQLLDFPFLSFKAISASVYVDRYNTYTGDVSSNQSSSIVLEPIETVWKNLQKGNTDAPEIVFFTGQARLKTKPDSGSLTVFDKIDMVGDKTTVPTTGSILFKVEGTNTTRFTRATLYAPFLNTVYRTDEYGAVIELYNESTNLEG